MLVPHDQNAGQNWDIKIGNRSFENVSQFKYLGTTVQNKQTPWPLVRKRTIPTDSNNSEFDSRGN
jgi:hypothetical protein